MILRKEHFFGRLYDRSDGKFFLLRRKYGYSIFLSDFFDAEYIGEYLHYCSSFYFHNKNKVNMPFLII